MSLVSKVLQHGLRQRRYLAAISVIMLIISALFATAVWAKKEPKFKDKKIYYAPETANGQRCINRCSSAQERCKADCRKAYEPCRAEAERKAKVEHEKALRKHKERYKVCYEGTIEQVALTPLCKDGKWLVEAPVEGTYVDRQLFQLGCDNECGCTGQYDNCYRTCGGRVTVENRCVKNCDQIKEGSKYYNKIQKKLKQTPEEVAAYEKKMRKDDRYMKPAPGKALIYVIRPGGSSVIFKYEVSVDGKKVGTILPHSFMTYEVNPGWHVIRTKKARKKGTIDTLVIPLETDRVYFVKVDPSEGKLAILTLGQGTKQLKQCKKKIE